MVNVQPLVINQIIFGDEERRGHSKEQLDLSCLVKILICGEIPGGEGVGENL